MTRRAYRIVAFVLLAWLPLQAAALPSLALLCGSHSDEMAGMAHTATSDHSGSHHNHDGGPDGSGGSNGEDTHPASGHMCCNHFSAVPVSIAFFRAEPVPFEGSTPVLHAYSFFPDQPQRPPRASTL